MVDRDQLSRGLSSGGVHRALHQDIGGISVEIQNAHIKDRDLVNFIRWEYIGAKVLNRAIAVNEKLKGSEFLL